MPQVDVGRREARCVIVYHGPRRAGKTETLQAIRHAVPPERRGDVVSAPSGAHEALILEELVLSPCVVGDLRVRLSLYALPDHEALPLLGDLLRRADGVVFVADAQQGRLDDDRRALAALEEAFAHAGASLDAVPLAFQWNKSDLPSALPVSTLARALDGRGRPGYAASATTGRGVLPPLRDVSLAALKALPGAFDAAPALRLLEAIPSFNGRRRPAA